MKIVLISVLLFFELCSGFSIQKLQVKEPKPKDLAENQSDVYVVEDEDDYTVRLVYPKSEKPVLGEIIYYHVVETPYEEEGSESLDFDETRRPFTNGHGYQFLNEDPEIYDFTTKIADIPDETSRGSVLEFKSVYSSSPNGPDVEYVMNNKGDFVQVPEENITSKLDSAKVTPKVVEAKNSPSSITNKKQNARNELYNLARDKYQSRRHVSDTPNHRPTQVTPPKTWKPVQDYTHRRKREISSQKMPPAPSLPPLDLKILPEYIRRIISTPKPEITTPLKEEQKHFNEDKFKEEVGQKIHDMISSMKPLRDGDEDSYEDSDEEVEEQNEDEDDHNKDEDYNNNNKRVPRTYGMNLTMGHGYVWNDLLSEPGTPGMSFDVGNPDREIIEETDVTKKPDEQEATAEPIRTEEPSTEPATPTDNILHPTESKPIHINENHKEDKKEDNDKIKPDEETTSQEDLKDIEINTIKPKSIDIDDNSLEHYGGSEGNDVKNKHNEFDSQHKHDQNREENDGKNKHIKEFDQHKKKSKVHHKPETPDVIKELMNNEEFWKWLSDWTATYMELLMKHIKDIVEDEVASQMKILAAKLKKDEEQKREHSEKDVSECNCTEKPSKEENHINNNSDKPVVDNDKLIIDGKEIPITHTTNFDNKDEKGADHSEKSKPEEENDKEHNSNSKSAFLKHRKHKEDKKKPKEPVKEITTDKSSEKENNKSPISITAQNIFGNAAGSDKVTNIFIFYPNDDESDDDDTEKTHKEPNNIFSFKPNNDFAIDQRHPHLLGTKDESTDTELQNKPNIKPNNDINPNDILNKNNEEKNVTQAELATTTPKNEIEKSENKVDKIETENKTPVKENNTNIEQSNINDENISNINSSDSNAVTTSAPTNNKHSKEKENKIEDKSKDDNKKEDESKEKEGKNTDSEKQDKSKDDNKIENESAEKEAKNTDSEKQDKSKEDNKKEDESKDKTESNQNRDQYDDMINKKEDDGKTDSKKNPETSTESSENKLESTTASSLDKKEHKDENLADETKISEITENSHEDNKLEKIITKELEKELNKVLSKEIEKEIEKEEDSIKKEIETADKEVSSDKGSEKTEK